MLRTIYHRERIHTQLKILRRNRDLLMITDNTNEIEDVYTAGKSVNTNVFLARLLKFSNANSEL